MTSLWRCCDIRLGLRSSDAMFPPCVAESADPRQLKTLLAPYPSERMTGWPVSARVGNVKNNDQSLIEPIAGVV